MKRRALFMSAEHRLLCQHAEPEGLPRPEHGETPDTPEAQREAALKNVQNFYAAPGFQNVYQQYGQNGVDASMFMYFQQQGMPMGYPMPGMDVWGAQYPMYMGQYGPQANPYMGALPPATPPPSGPRVVPAALGRRRRPGPSVTPPATTPPPGAPPWAPPTADAPPTPEYAPPAAALSSTEILNPTSFVGIKFPGPGGVQQSVYINSRTLALQPSNGSDMLAAAGVRVYPSRFGDIHTFRIQFTRPGIFAVGWKDRMERYPYQWQDITVSGTAGAPPTGPRIAPRGPGVRPPDAPPPAAYNRVEYSGDARSFVQTRLEWVRTNAEDPNSQMRRFANIVTTNTSTVLDRHLDAPTNGVTIRKLSPPRDNRTYEMEVTDGATTDRWYITEFVSGTTRIVFQNQADMLMQVGGNRSSYITNTAVNATAIKAALRSARSRRASESADAANVRNFDLPRGESILYTGVFDQTDPTEENHARHFGAFLGSRGYNIVGGGTDTFAATTNLLGTLESRFDNALRAGIKNHYLYFSVHGSESRIAFDTPGGSRLYLEPAQLMNLFKKSKYNDCRFVLRMNCCNSGGFQSGRMAEQFRAAGESGRISVFIQTKPELPNPIRTTGGAQNYDTPYDYYLVHFLNQGMTYGQAHVAADEATKRNFPGLDAGVFRSDPGGGLETASLPPDDRPAA